MGDASIFTYAAQDMEFSYELNQAFLSGVSGGMNAIYSDILS